MNELVVRSFADRILATDALRGPGLGPGAHLVAAGLVVIGLFALRRVMLPQLDRDQVPRAVLTRIDRVTRAGGWILAAALAVIVLGGGLELSGR